jgi:hypothetical protein
VSGFGVEGVYPSDDVFRDLGWEGMDDASEASGEQAMGG